jgi:hypothetical protein
MRLFDFFKKIVTQKNSVDGDIFPKYKEVDRSNWTGKDFEFLITGNIDIKNEEFDNIMTPTLLEWIKVERDNWIYYKVGSDEFSYSIEPPGIQMVFNKDVSFTKAKIIVDEIIDNLKAKGQKAGLIIIDSREVYKF